MTLGLPRRPVDLTGRVVAITGSTGGFGDALAAALVGRGAEVALIGRRTSLVEAQAARLSPVGTTSAWTADVTDLLALEEVMAGIAAHHGRLDVVVANAGIDQVASLESQTEAEFVRLVDINLTGVWRTFKAAAPYVGPGGQLLAISSMAAFVHSPLQGAYCASKAGVLALCDAIRMELRSRDIAVGTVHPTFFDTPLMDEVRAEPAGDALWRGHTGMWRFVELDVVVADTVTAIERQADLTVVPRALRPVALTSALARRTVERLGFRSGDVARAVALAGRR